MSEHLLEVRDLAVSFDTYAGEVQAVRGISYYLDKGETLSIVGESGCGKSVSCQTIMKLLPSPPARIKSGSILYKGEELVTKTDKEMEAYRGKEFSMVFQDSMTSLNPTMRVGRQLCEGIIKHQKVSREKAKEIAIEMLRQVGLPNPEKTYMRYPHTLSGGMRQRVMIAIAIACNPQILFADEPTTALDVTMQAQILDLMNGLKQKLGTAIILITHDLGSSPRWPTGSPSCTPAGSSSRGRRTRSSITPNTPTPGGCWVDAERRAVQPRSQVGADEHPRHPARPLRAAEGLRLRRPVQLLHGRLPERGRRNLRRTTGTRSTAGCLTPAPPKSPRPSGRKPERRKVK